MKFNNLKEIIDYLGLCSFCGRKRKLDFDIGPDDPGFEELDYLKLGSSTIKEDILTLNVVAKLNSVIFRIPYIIDCINNVFRVGEPYIITNDKQNKVILPSELFLWVWGVCKYCKSRAESEDVKFDFQQNTIDRFVIILEEFELENFIIKTWPQKTVIYHHSRVSENYNEIKQIAILPPADLDLSDKDKLLEQLETFRLFS